MRIAILAPDSPGGVSFYCSQLSKAIQVNCNLISRGSPERTETALGKIIRLLFHYLFFIYKLLTNRYDLIHQNTSLGRLGVKRDAIYLTISKIFKKRVLVFFHGWDQDYANWVATNPNCALRKIFIKADGFVVLANDFKNTLIEWGFPEEKIFVETTIVDESLLTGYDNDSKLRVAEKNVNILFLARIEKHKGIYEAVNAYAILKEKMNNVELFIAGDGSETIEVTKYVKKKNIPDIYFVGYVTGREKRELFGKSHIYVFPTNHFEGMPITVLEAMSFGLPVITRPVGGIKDFFENGKMGFLTQSNNPEDFAGLIEKLLCDRENLSKISKYNFNYAKEHFYASTVAKRIEDIYSLISK